MIYSHATKCMWEALETALKAEHASDAALQLRQAIADGADILSKSGLGIYPVYSLIDATAKMYGKDRQEILGNAIPRYKSLIEAEGPFSEWGLLHHAAKAGNAEALRLFLKEGANPNGLKKFQLDARTPPIFHCANPECFYTLLDAGADVIEGKLLINGKLVIEVWPPERAGVIFDPAVFEKRGKQLSDMYRKLIFRKRASRNFDGVMDLWQQNFPVLITDESASYKDTAALWEALKAEDYDGALQALHANADAHSTDLNGRSVLHFIAAHKEANPRLVESQKRLLKACIAKGLSVDVRHAIFTCAPLHVAVAQDNMPVVQALVEAGAKVNGPCDNGDTPLHCVHEKASPEITRFLLHNGADMGLQNDFNCTPMQAWKPETIANTLRHYEAIDRQAELLPLYDAHYDGLSAEKQETWNNHFSSPEVRREAACDDYPAQRYRKRPADGRQR